MWNPCQVAAENVNGECSAHKDRAYPEAPVTMHTLPVRARAGFTAVATISFVVVSVPRHHFSASAGSGSEAIMFCAAFSLLARSWPIPMVKAVPLASASSERNA